MTYVVILLAFLLVAAGIIFAVLPPLPGPLLSLAAVYVVHFASEVTYSNGSLIFWTILVVLILIADYTLPIMATKKFGGTKEGVYGGIIGTIAGVILPIPFGIIIGPLLGAIIGDLFGGNRLKAAFKSGFGSFIGFIVATTLKVVTSVSIGVSVVYKGGSFTFNQLF